MKLYFLRILDLWSQVLEFAQLPLRLMHFYCDSTISKWGASASTLLLIERHIIIRFCCLSEGGGNVIVSTDLLNRYHNLIQSSLTFMEPPQLSFVFKSPWFHKVDDPGAIMPNIFWELCRLSFIWHRSFLALRPAVSPCALMRSLKIYVHFSFINFFYLSVFLLLCCKST